MTAQPTVFAREHYKEPLARLALRWGLDPHQQLTEQAEAFARLLADMATQRVCYLILDAAPSGGRFIQFAIAPQLVHAEVSSNVNLERRDWLTPDDEQALADLGWQPPTTDVPVSSGLIPCPNWYRRWDGPVAVGTLTIMTIGALNVIAAPTPAHLLITFFWDEPRPRDILLRPIRRRTPKIANLLGLPVRKPRSLT